MQKYYNISHGFRLYFLSKWILLFIVFIIVSNYSFAQEICDDGVDNDQDGYIDYYDQDCPCDEELFNAICEVENLCPIEPDSLIKFSLKWKTEVLNNDVAFRTSDIRTTSDNYILIGTHKRIVNGDIENSVILINSLDVSSINSIIVDTTSSPIIYNFAIALNNGSQSLFVYKNGLKFICKTFQNNLLWETTLQGINRLFTYPKIADFNNDGINEVYGGNLVLNSETGLPLFFGKLSKGCNFVNEFDTCSLGTNSIAADFTSSQGLELACGNLLYEITFNNLTDTTGNISNIIVAPPEVKEGFTSMGDFDQDGLLDIVSTRSNSIGDGGIWIWNPRDQTIIASILHPSGVGLNGGLPIITDINNDCSLEIIIIYKDDLRVYSYNGSPNLSLLYSITGQDESGFTSPSVFDLNGDGSMELISRDEDNIYIFDGTTGIGLDSFPIMAITGLEQPIITDTDNDGHAEILIHGSDDHPDSLRLFCLESANFPWAPARKVWNQTGYHVTNVNDDLTIPQYQQNSAAFFDTDSCYYETCPQVYNNFGVQATFRTQKGCLVLPEDTISQIEILGENILLCPGDTSVFTVDDMFVNIYWTSDAELSCIDCDSVQIVSDTSVWLVVEAIDDQCSTIDSIYIEVKDLIELQDSAQICYGDSILFFGQALKETGSYQHEINDCDSIASFNLIVDDRISEDVRLDVCDEDSTIVDGMVYTIDGVYEIILEASNGCDSILNLDLRFLESSSLNDTISICEGDSILIQGNWYYQGDLFTMNMDNSVGCDSLIDLFIKGIDVLSDEDQISICEGDSILIDNQWIKEAGDYPIELMSESGCDSIFTYMVTVVLPQTESIEREICFGDTLTIENVEIFEEGIHDVTITALSGCDSIISVDLSISDEIIQLEYDSICTSDSIFIIDQWISSPGEYSFDLMAENGCDSTIIYEITEIQFEFDTTNYLLCEGDSVLINNQWIKDAGTFKDTIPTSNCRLVNQNIVEIIPLIEGSSILSLCEGETLTIENIVITAEGEYPIIYTTIEGCDSLHTYIITQLDFPEAPIIDFNCDQDAYEASVQADDTWLIEWSNGGFANTALFIESGPAFLILSNEENCNLEYLFIIPEFSSFGEFIPIEDQILKTDDSLEVSLDLDNKDWSIIWDNVAAVSCDTCFAITITVEENTEIIYTLTNNEGCTESYSFLISIEENQIVDFPNVFSPNGDNVNDEFIIDLSIFPENEFLIYDRWGSNVFRSKNESTVRWNGTLKNSPVENGVYVYLLRYRDQNGNSLLKAGDLTVLR